MAVDTEGGAQSSVLGNDETEDLSPRQPIENLNPPVDRRVGRGIADAEMRVVAAKDLAGDDEQVVADRLVNERASAVARCSWIQVEGAARGRELVAVAEAGADAIALVAVL